MASPVAVLSVVLLVACAAHGARLPRQFQGEVSQDGCVVDGVTYPIGATVPDYRPCHFCQCFAINHGVHVLCGSVIKSDGVNRICESVLHPYPPPCADAVFVEGGECCSGYWTCPNGPNCSIGGQIVSDGQSIDMGNGMTYYCEANDTHAFTHVYTTTTPTTTTPRPTTTTPRPTPTTTTPTYY